MCVWCIYVYMMCALCVNVHKCVPQSKCGGQRTTSMLVLTFYLVWHRALCIPGWLAGERQGLSSLFLQSHNRNTEVTEWCYWTWLYVGSRCSNSGPHAFTVSTLSPCPSPIQVLFYLYSKANETLWGKYFVCVSDIFSHSSKKFEPDSLPQLFCMLRRCFPLSGWLTCCCLGTHRYDILEAFQSHGPE